MINNKKIVSIFGNAGAGKSTLTKALVSTVGSTASCRVCADYYLKSRGGIPLETFLLSTELYDWDLLREDLAQPVGTKISTPTYNYTEFQRINRQGDKAFIVSPIMFVDSAIPYPDADIFVLIELDDQLRKRRVIDRTRGDSVWKSFVLNNWSDCSVDFELYQADAVLDGNAPLEDSVHAVCRLLEEIGNPQ